MEKHKPDGDIYIYSPSNLDRIWPNISEKRGGSG